ncbi:Hypothetical protein, putative [Bodo saltans]|uniref:Uncharacterized protein n=1 Tax=Bodo saltans TaxID=75058 RepID=A0A0S4J084_BODSA|nr:Hypothetical protein, putative [Bodo saltans]|eukprot:CUG06233.1 Hypothetical protein, putative [Bodo saltans]
MGSMMCTCSFDQPSMQGGTKNKSRPKAYRNHPNSASRSSAPQEQKLSRHHLESSTNILPSSGGFHHDLEPATPDKKLAIDLKDEEVITVPRGRRGQGGTSGKPAATAPAAHIKMKNSPSKESILLPQDVAPMMDSLGSASHSSSLNIRSSIRVVAAPPALPSADAAVLATTTSRSEALKQQQNRGNSPPIASSVVNPLALQPLQPAKSTPTNLSSTLDPDSSMELQQPQTTTATTVVIRSSAHSSSLLPPSGIVSSSGITVVPMGRHSMRQQQQQQQMRSSSRNNNTDDDDERGVEALLMDDVDAPPGMTFVRAARGNN